MGLRDTGPVSRAALVMMSAKTDQSVMIVMIGSQANCHKLITPAVSKERVKERRDRLRCPTILSSLLISTHTAFYSAKRRKGWQIFVENVIVPVPGVPVSWGLTFLFLTD